MGTFFFAHGSQTVPYTEGEPHEMIDGKKAERTLRARFRAVGSIADANWQKAYMKSALTFHGVRSAEIGSAARDLLATNADLDHDGLVTLVDHLFSSPWFDIRSVGLAMLDRKVKELKPSDLAWLIELVRRGACWAHVDPLATSIIAGVVTAEPKTLRLLPTWAKDDDFWVRRNRAPRAGA
jgi:3-methyladenine DNA glycosylase AlkD